MTKKDEILHNWGDKNTNLGHCWLYPGQYKVEFGLVGHSSSYLISCSCLATAQLVTVSMDSLGDLQIARPDQDSYSELSQARESARTSIWKRHRWDMRGGVNLWIPGWWGH